MCDDRRVLAGLIADQRDAVGVQQPLHLGRDGVEDGARRLPLGDQCRHPPQRRLLIGDPFMLAGDPSNLGVEQGVVDGHGQLAGDEPDGVEPVGGERTASEPVLQQQHGTGQALGEDG